MILRMVSRIVGLTVIFAAVAGAQELPTHERGLVADTVYQGDDVSLVNEFNGNLVITLPIGKSYPVGPSLSYGLSAVFNSTAWTADERQCLFNNQLWDYALPFPDPRATGGLGWHIHLGRLFAPNHEPYNGANYWSYVTPDGSQHLFREKLHPGHPADDDPHWFTWYTQDGTFLRMRRFLGSSEVCADPPPNALTGSDCYRIEFPSGTMHEYHAFPTGEVSDWRLTRIRDRFNNWIDLKYPDTSRTLIVDSHGRTQTIHRSGGRVTQVDLTAFDGTIASYVLHYTSTVIQRQRFWPPSCATEDPTVTVDLLTRLELPDGSYYQIEYNTTDSHPEYLSGGVKELRLPTGGKYVWTYQQIDFIRTDPPYQDIDWSRITFGVATKEIYEDSTSTTPSATWRYQFDTVGNPSLPPDDSVPCYHAVTASDPAGNDTVTYFATSHSLHQWRYALPMTVCDPHNGGAEYPAEGPFLSQEIYEGSVATGTRLRSVWVDYESDGRSYGAVVGWNHRLRYRKVVYHDDGDRFIEETFSGRTGLGRYRTAVANADFGDAGTRTVETLYHPEYGEFVINPETMEEDPSSTFVMPARDDPWVLTTFTERRVSDSGDTAITQMCFDPDTGFLERQRVLAGASPAKHDLLTLFEQEEIAGASTGRVASQLSYGGDDQISMDNTYTDLCEMTVSGLVAQYRMDHTYTSGVLSSSKWVDPCDGTEVLSAADYDVDPSTGLIATSRDPSGVATALVYNNSGRLTSEQSESGAWIHYHYQVPTTSHPSLALHLTIETCANGLSTCSGADLLGWKRSYYDGLGRMIQETLRYPAQTGLVDESHWMTYDVMGRKATESSWGDAALVTAYGPYDRFGRLGKVQPPGSNPATQVTYQGDRVVTREVKIATGAAGERTSVFTTEIYDPFGRLERVCEAQESAWAGTCTGIETSYTYDNRGFLTGERHPEFGPTGNGWTYYSYDALGNALSRILAGTSDFALLYTYDRASRLIRIDEVTGPDESRPLKEFYFARTNDGSDLRKGKLVRAKRHNWVDVVAPLRVSGTLDAVITDSYRYEGLGGRPSLRQTSYQLNATTFAFRTRYEYDEQGNYFLRDLSTSLKEFNRWKRWKGERE
ncbi:MAG: hypothetical protein GY856_43335 [bacterium]|nr:hypothetical protein [bacterium]